MFSHLRAIALRRAGTACEMKVTHDTNLFSDLRQTSQPGIPMDNGFPNPPLVIIPIEVVVQLVPFMSSGLPAFLGKCTNFEDTNLGLYRLWTSHYGLSTEHQKDNSQSSTEPNRTIPI